LVAGIAVVACLFVAGMTVDGLAQRPERVLAVIRENAPRVVLAQERGPRARLMAATRAQATPRPAAPASNAAEDKKDSGGWLDGIQAAGFRNLDVDQLIALKIHGVTGEYIRQIRAAGLQLTPDELVAFRIHGVTADFINELKQTGLRNLEAKDLVALRIHGAEPAWIRQIQSLGYANLSVNNIVALRIHGVTPEFIRDAQKHGLQDLSIDKLIQLKRLGILKTSAIVFI